MKTSKDECSLEIISNSGLRARFEEWERKRSMVCFVTVAKILGSIVDEAILDFSQGRYVRCLQLKILRPRNLPEIVREPEVCEDGDRRYTRFTMQAL